MAFATSILGAPAAHVAKAPPRRGEALLELQAIRFFAALSVLIGHVQYEVLDKHVGSPAWRGFELFDWGAGVDLFFIVSGFIMTYVSWGKFAAPGASAQFVQARLLRVAPTYWLFTTLMLGSMLVLKDSVTHDQASLPHVLASYAFTPWPRPGDGLLYPILSLGWTLNYEMLFYAVFAVALVFRRGRGLAVAAGVLLTLALAHAVIPPSLFAAAFWSKPIVLEFLLGMTLGGLHRPGVRLRGPARALLAGAGLALLGPGTHAVAADSVLRPLCWGGPAFLIVAGVMLGAPARRARRLLAPLALGGDASYALYLSHPFAINLVVLAWRPLGEAHPWAFVAAASLVALAGGLCAYLFVERPLIGFLRERSPPARAAGAAAAPTL